MNPDVKAAIGELFDEAVPLLISRYGTEIPEPHLLWLDLDNECWSGAPHPRPIPVQSTASDCKSCSSRNSSGAATITPSQSPCSSTLSCVTKLARSASSP